jgi:hypothetical protein
LVAAAEQTGMSGNVITFEGSEDAVENVEDTINLNGVASQVSVRHAIVSRAISLRGSEGDAEIVAPEDLPDCDILVLDCEGTEIEILEKLDFRPRAIIVETHGLYGATESEVRNKLSRAGYDVVERAIAEKRLQTFCEDNDIYVLYSVLSNNPSRKMPPNEENHLSS